MELLFTKTLLDFIILGIYYIGYNLKQFRFKLKVIYD